MSDELYRVEATLCAMNTGNLDPGSWPHSHIMAHGLAGQSNPLGYAIDHLLGHQSLDNLKLVVTLLAGQLEKMRISQRSESVDNAKDAIAWYMDKRCDFCGGNGVLDFQQTQCPACLGRHEKPKPTYAPIRLAIGLITASVELMESQLRNKLRK